MRGSSKSVQYREVIISVNVQLLRGPGDSIIGARESVQCKDARHISNNIDNNDSYKTWFPVFSRFRATNVKHDYSTL